MARLTLPETYRSQVQHIQQSPKFQPRPEEQGGGQITPPTGVCEKNQSPHNSLPNSHGGRQAVPFPGYSAITPPEPEDSQNFGFYENLNGYQQQLKQLTLDSGLIVPVPPPSFHLTLADLIWDSAYRYANENYEFEVQLRSRVANTFEQYKQSTTQTNPIRWQMLGLLVMPRSVGVCLVPKDENSYEEIWRFRRTIYQNPGLTALGIEQHYHFTAHITLGYFGDISPNLDRDRLSATFSELNQQWIENSPELLVHRAELRKFDDMTRYYREPDWPVLDF